MTLLRIYCHTGWWQGRMLCNEQLLWSCLYCIKVKCWLKKAAPLLRTLAIDFQGENNTQHGKKSGSGKKWFNANVFAANAQDWQKPNNRLDHIIHKWASFFPPGGPSAHDHDSRALRFTDTDLTLYEDWQRNICVYREVWKTGTHRVFHVFFFFCRGGPSDARPFMYNSTMSSWKEMRDNWQIILFTIGQLTFLHMIDSCKDEVAIK